MVQQSVPSLPPLAQLDQLITGCWKSQLVYVTAKLGLADHLSDGPLSSEVLAARTGCHAPTLERLLRGLASIELVTLGADNRYTLTPIGAGLRTDAPGNMRVAAIKTGENWNWGAWGQLLHTVQTGQTAFDHAFGQPFYRYLDDHPEASFLFSEFMASFLAKMCAPLVLAYDFSTFKSVVDVGAGHGIMTAALLRAYPTLRCVAFDRPSVIEKTKHILQAQGLADRCDFYGGDFFEALPAGHDCYILSMILDDWEDEESIAILSNCRQAVAPGGKVLVAQHLIQSTQASLFGSVMDLYMMVLTGGRERNEDAYRSLFERAGLNVSRVVPSYSLMSIIEGIPA